jgi:hypothetical protein
LFFVCLLLIRFYTLNIYVLFLFLLISFFSGLYFSPCTVRLFISQPSRSYRYNSYFINRTMHSFNADATNLIGVSNVIFHGNTPHLLEKGVFLTFFNRCFICKRGKFITSCISKFHPVHLALEGKKFR